jgi:hypothetical protein
MRQPLALRGGSVRGGARDRDRHHAEVERASRGSFDSGYLFPEKKSCMFRLTRVNALEMGGTWRCVGAKQPI